MPSLNYVWACLLVDELVRCGVECFCLAPGSRSTPLTAAVARNPQAQSIVHYDERGTAFFALGYARATGKPAAWITTSGTAVANGLPAVVEADADDVPLLLLTADRPPELRETGANQTIDQPQIFQKYVRWAFDMPAPSPEIEARVIETTAAQAVFRARNGPVHLNCMFRKPLHPMADDGMQEAADAAFAAQRTSDTPFTDYERTIPAVSQGSMQTLARWLRQFDRGLLVAGRAPAHRSNEAALQLADRLGWPLLADVTSGLRFGDDCDARIAHYDLLLGNRTFRARYRPQAVLHLGRPGVSSRLTEYLSDARPSFFALAAETESRLDPTHQVTHRYTADLPAFCRALADALSDPELGTWYDDWHQHDVRMQEMLSATFTGHVPTSEPLITYTLCNQTPADTGLFLASSMPVRDMNRFAPVDTAAIRIGANRGASGIDGTVASAAGFARGLDRPVTLLIGDLALLHDLNSLAMLNQGPPVIIIVLNNDGGGIFSFLPIAEYDQIFEPYFGTPHGLTFEAAAEMYSLPYHRMQSRTQMYEFYRETVASNTSALIEVRTDRRENVGIHEEIDSMVQEVI